MLRDLAQSYHNDAAATPALLVVDAASALDKRMRNAVVTVSAAVSGLGPSTSPVARRTGGAGRVNALTLTNVRLLVYVIYTIIEVVIITVRMLYLCVTYINFRSLILRF